MSDDSGSGLSGRQAFAAGTTGLIAASAGGPARARPEADDGTPEQIHLSWGDDPARTVVVSWASAAQAVRPRVRIGERVIPAVERAGPHPGAAGWTYHARVDGLRPGATYGYAVTADNDANAADPFSGTFTTAPEGRAKFRFTSFGDLAAPGESGAALAGQAGYAVAAVESFQPLFHLLNSDLAGAGGIPSQAGREVGNQVQASAAYRPWLPVPGGHQPAAGQPAPGGGSFLAGEVFSARDDQPASGTAGHDGRWYAFRVGTALFVTLSGDDVAYRDAPARGYSGGAQTRWLEATLAAARGDASIDWIVVQLHHCACSSGTGAGRSGSPDRSDHSDHSDQSGPGGPGRTAGTASGSDLGVRREWLPLFDTYEVDLVLSGHDRGYERSFPVRGVDPGAGADVVTGTAADTCRPHPVTTVDSGVFDTSQGTVHLVLGGGTVLGGGNVLGAGGDRMPPEDNPGTGSALVARVFTRPAAPLPVPVPDARAPGDWAAGDTGAGDTGAGDAAPAVLLPGDEAAEVATWSARRDTAAGPGIAVFDVNPGAEAGGQTSIIVRYYHAAGPDPLAAAAAEPGGDYLLFDAFTLVRPRSDGRRWHPRG